MMSIRSQLIWWQIVLLVCIVVGFGATLRRQFQTRAKTDFDQQLSINANRLAHVCIKDAAVDQKPEEDEPSNSPKQHGGPWWKKAGGLPPGQLKKLRTAEINDEELDRLLAQQPNLGFAVWDGKGRLIRSSDFQPDCGFSEFLKPAEAMGNEPGLTTVQGYRCAAAIGRLESRVVVFESLSGLVAQRERMEQTIFLSGLGILIVGLLGVLILSRRIIHQIERMASAASEISVGNPQRLQTDNAPRELANLCKPINDAFDRLDESYQREKQFSANVSHELRTPLAVLMSQTELVLSRDRSASEYRKGLEVCDGAAKRMNKLVQQLMMTCGDDTEMKSQTCNVDLRQLVMDCVELLKPSASHRMIEVRNELAAVTIAGDPQLLSQMVTHLIVNAISHNNEEGSVSVTLADTEDSVCLSVADDGPGMSSIEQRRVFEPFYKPDASRTRGDRLNQGFGLGLSICQRVAAAHNGEISLSSEPDVGTTVTVTLPKNATDN